MKRLTWVLGEGRGRGERAGSIFVGVVCSELCQFSANRVSETHVYIFIVIVK